MSIFLEDPRLRRIKGNDGKRRDRAAIRIGDEVGSQNQSQNQNPLMADVPSIQPLPQRQQNNPNPYNSMWGNTPNIFSTNSNPNQSVQTSSTPQGYPQNTSQNDELSFVTTESLQKRREEGQNALGNQNFERPTSANPIISQANQEVIQNSNLQPTQPQKRNQSEWLVAIDGFSQRSIANESFPIFIPKFTQRAEQKLGKPRKIMVSAPIDTSANNPIITEANPPYFNPVTQNSNIIQAEPQDNLQNQDNSANNVYPQTNILTNPQNSLLQQRNTNDHRQSSISQATLMKYLQSQMVILTNQINAAFAKKTQFEPLSKMFFKSSQLPSIPSSHTRFLENLQIDLSEIDFSTIINPYYRFEFSQGSNQENRNLIGINPKAVDYFMLFQYFTRQQAVKNKTSNLFLVLKTLQEATTKQPSSLKSQKKAFQQTKIKDMKEYIPFLVSIKRWHDRANGNLKIFREKLNNIQKRTTFSAEDNLIRLKNGASQSKKTLKLLKLATKSFSLLSEQSVSTEHLLKAYNMNIFHFSFDHPDNGMVLICQQIYEDFKSMLTKTNQLECFYPKICYTRAQVIQNVDLASLHLQLFQKLAFQCGNLEDLQAKVRKMKAKLSRRQSSQPGFLKDNENSSEFFKMSWRIVNLLRVAQSIIINRKRKQIINGK